MFVSLQVGLWMELFQIGGCISACDYLFFHSLALLSPFFSCRKSMNPVTHIHGWEIDFLQEQSNWGEMLLHIKKHISENYV